MEQKKQHKSMALKDNFMKNKMNSLYLLENKDRL